MTSGTKTTGSGNYQSVNFVSFGSSRTWSGADGKTTADGRTKWNNYSVQAGIRSTKDPNTTFDQWSNSPSPGKWTRNLKQPISAGWGGVDPDLGPNYLLKLQSKLAEKIKGHDWNLAVDASQLAQTSGMVVGAIKTLTKAALAISHGDVVNAARAFSVHPSKRLLKARNAESRWLELQYGWLPTLQSAYEAHKAYHAITKKSRATHFAVSKTGSIVQEVGSGVSRAYVTRKKSVYIQCEVYEPLSAPRSLGLVDPASVLWEHIPYSFVIDWFIPIGTYISTINSIPAIKGRFLTTTVLRATGFTFKFVADGPKAPTEGAKIMKSMPSIEGKTTDMSRVYSTTLIVPKPTFNVAGAVHGTRIANAVALAGPVFRRIFGS